MIVVHRNPPSAGLPFRRVLLPLASPARLRLKQQVDRERSRDPDALVLVASLLDEDLGAVAGGADSTAGYAASPHHRRRALEASLRIARAWTDHLPDAATDALRHAGVFLPDLCRWEAHYAALAVVDFIQKVDALLEERRPSRLVVFGNADHVGIARRVAQARGVPFRGRPLRTAGALNRLVGRAGARIPVRVEAASGGASGGASEGGCDVLLLGNGRGSALNAAAVAGVLPARSLRPRIVAYAGNGADALAADGVPFEDLAPWIPSARAQGSRLVRRRLRRAWRTVRRMDMPGAFTFDGIDFTDPWGRDLMGWVVLRRSPFLARMLDAADAMVRAWGPRVVVTGFDQDYDARVFAAVARNHGIPSVSIQDGVYVDADLVGLATDVVCTDGPATASEVHRSGVPGDRIVVTGQPRHDSWAGHRDGVRGPRDRRVLLVFASTGRDSAANASQKERYEAAVVEAFRTRPDWEVWIKLHPQDDGAVTRRVLAGRDAPNVRVVGGSSAEELLARADVALCTTLTTAAQDAVLAGRPVLILDLDREEPMAEFVAGGVAVFVHDAADLTAAVDAALEEAPRREEVRVAFLRERFIVPDGGSSERVARVVERLAAPPAAAQA